MTVARAAVVVLGALAWVLGSGVDPARAAVRVGGNFSIDSEVLDAGGHTASVGRFSLRDSISAGPIGESSGVAFSMQHGFPTVVAALVEGRWIFYDGSSFDDGPGVDPNDDAAIAVDKEALLPGGVASFLNYSSYSRGLNGVMVDIAYPGGTPAVDDFEFRVGNDNNPAGWGEAASPLSVSVRPGAGTGGSTRITLIWAGNNRDEVDDPNEAVTGQWLEITVKAGPNTGLPEPDVFYFGNAIGETGEDPGNARVSTADIIRIRNNPRTFLNPAGITDPFDVNRDASVNAQDRLLARNAKTTFLDELRLMNLSGAGGSTPGFEPVDPLRLRSTGSPMNAALGVVDGTAVLSFEGPPGTGYAVFASTSLTEGWKPAAGEVVEVAPGRFQVHHAPDGGGTLFYKVVPVIYEDTDFIPRDEGIRFESIVP